jgi:hypothetical protein
MYAKFYNPSIIVLLKVKVIFKQYISKKHKFFGIKIYKLCTTTSYSYSVSVYLKDWQSATQTMTATHVKVRSRIRIVKGVSHKLCMDNFFSSADLFDDLHTRALNFCDTVRQIHKGMSGDFNNKT